MVGSICVMGPSCFSTRYPVLVLQSFQSHNSPAPKSCKKTGVNPSMIFIGGDAANMTGDVVS